MPVSLPQTLRPRVVDPQWGTPLATVLGTILVLGAILALGTAPALAQGDSTPSAEPQDDSRQIERRLPARDAGRLSLDIPVGSLAIVGWDRPEVVFEAQLGPAVRGLAVEADGQRIHLATELDDGDRTGDDAAVHLTLRMPAASRLKVRTVAASVEVRNALGHLDLQSASGPITVVDGAPREVTAASVSGNLHFESPALVLHSRTVSGRTVLRRTVEDVQLWSSTGDLEVVAPAGEDAMRVLGEMRLSTVSGRIDYRGRLEPTGRLQISSHHGPIHLALPAEQLDIDTPRLVVESLEGSIERSELRF